MVVVKVQFLGICTHFHRENHGGLPAGRRVVLINAKEPRHIHHHEIPAHYAQIGIGKECWPLEGCRFQLTAIGAKPPVAREQKLSVPNLKKLMKDMLHPPSREVLLDENRDRAAAYFDFDDGTVEACLTRNNAIGTILTVEAEEVRITATPFPNGAVPEPFRHPMRFTEGSTILWLANLDGSPHKTPWDFLLHYATSQRVPPHPELPPEPSGGETTCIDLPCALDAIGSGCSNSDYP